MGRLSHQKPHSSLMADIEYRLMKKDLLKYLRANNVDLSMYAYRNVIDQRTIEWANNRLETGNISNTTRNAIWEVCQEFVDHSRCQQLAGTDARAQIGQYDGYNGLQMYEKPFIDHQFFLKKAYGE